MTDLPKETPVQLNLGCHLSVSGGYLKTAERALQIGANTFAFFTRNPRGASHAPDPEALSQLHEFLHAHAFAPLVTHAPYTLNLCSDKPYVCEYAEQTLREDLEALEALPGAYYNFHPGCHMRQGMETGIWMISEALNRIMQPEYRTIMLLETMAGKGSEVGGRFEEIRAILDKLNLPEKFGVCLDTCHVFDAGYDIADHLDDVLEAFDREIGLRRLYAVHLNDSRNAAGSHKDRHEKIGKGMIGLEAIVRVITHPKLQGLPFILETPNEPEGFMEEIRLLRDLHARHFSGGPETPEKHRGVKESRRRCCREDKGSEDGR